MAAQVRTVTVRIHADACGHVRRSAEVCGGPQSLLRLCGCVRRDAHAVRTGRGSVRMAADGAVRKAAQIQIYVTCLKKST